MAVNELHTILMHPAVPSIAGPHMMILISMQPGEEDENQATDENLQKGMFFFLKGG